MINRSYEIEFVCRINRSYRIESKLLARQRKFQTSSKTIMFCLFSLFGMDKLKQINRQIHIILRYLKPKMTCSPLACWKYKLI